jgi:hypothetical protein
MSLPFLHRRPLMREDPGDKSDRPRSTFLSFSLLQGQELQGIGSWGPSDENRKGSSVRSFNLVSGLLSHQITDRRVMHQVSCYLLLSIAVFQYSINNRTRSFARRILIILTAPGPSLVHYSR